jgi:hypothetical protein
VPNMDQATTTTTTTTTKTILGLKIFLFYMMDKKKMKELLDKYTNKLYELRGMTTINIKEDGDEFIKIDLEIKDEDTLMLELKKINERFKDKYYKIWIFTDTSENKRFIQEKVDMIYEIGGVYEYTRKSLIIDILNTHYPE